MEAFKKLIAILGHHFGPPRLFLLVAGWILALGVWGTIARSYLPMEHRLKWEIPLELKAPLYAKFDSGWYLNIMEYGYGPPPPAGKPSAHAFFPLYPTLAKVLHKTFAIHGFHAGLIVTYLCLFLAIPLFFREAAERLGPEGAWHSVGFLLLFPVAFFLTAVYAESLFLLLVLMAFREARHGRAKSAVLWGVLLALTRASALAAAPALFLAFLEKRDPGGGRPWGRALLVGGTPVLVVFAWIFGIGWVKGEPGLFFRAMGGWSRAASSWEGFTNWFWQMRLAVKFGYWMKEPTIAFDYGCALIVAVVGVFQFVRRKWADAAWTGAALLLPITTGLRSGMPRFLLVVYPVYFALAEGSRSSPRARLAAWIVSAVLLLGASAGFVNWHWVS